MEGEDYSAFTWGDQAPSGGATQKTSSGYGYEDSPFDGDGPAVSSWDSQMPSSTTTTTTTTTAAPPSSVPAPPASSFSSSHQPASVTAAKSSTPTASTSTATATATASAHSSGGGNKDLIITVCNPEKHGEGSVDAYVTYEVITKSTLPGYSAPEVSVRRRYQDFLWLKTELDKEYPASIVPPIPEKQRLDYMDRFSSAFIEKRQAGLQRFFDRVASHPVLSKAEMLKLFLESKPAAFETLKQTRKGKGFPDLGDTFMNAFNKVKFPDARFVAIAEYSQKLQEHLTNLEKIHQRLGKRETDMCEDLTNLGGVFNLLSSEDKFGPGFHKLGQATDRNALALKELNEKIELDIMGQFRDYLLYCEGLKAAIRQRDVQQVEYEELTASLESKLAERDGATNPQASKSWMSSLTGTTDPQKLQGQIDELQRAVDESSEESKKVNAQIMSELEYFNDQKTHDFKFLLHGYATSQLEYAQKMLDQWQEILPGIEDLKVD